MTTQLNYLASNGRLLKVGITSQDLFVRARSITYRGVPKNPKFKLVDSFEPAIDALIVESLLLDINAENRLISEFFENVKLVEETFSLVKIYFSVDEPEIDDYWFSDPMDMVNMFCRRLVSWCKCKPIILSERTKYLAKKSSFSKDIIYSSSFLENLLEWRGSGR